MKSTPIHDRQKEIRAAYRRLFATPDGEIVLRHILRNYVIRVTRVDEVDVKWLEGQRSVALGIARTAKGTDEKLTDQILSQLENPQE